MEAVPLEILVEIAEEKVLDNANLQEVVAMKKRCLVWLLCLGLSACTGIGQQEPAAVELKTFSLDSLDGVQATTGVSFDAEVSSDGKGALRVDAT